MIQILIKTRAELQELFIDETECGKTCLINGNVEINKYNV